MHHYNFPPFSVGETGFMRGPKRRDIGHGALAQRALEAVIPTVEDSRTRSGSSRRRSSRTARRRWARSAARRSRCMDAGVPIRRPSAASPWAWSRRATTTSSSPTSRAPRITSGTWTSRSPARRGHHRAPDGHQDHRRHAGDHAPALEQAKRAREFILDRMAETIAEPRTELAEHAPRISTRPDRPGADRPRHRQGRRDDPRARGRLRRPDRHRGGRQRSHLRDRRASRPRRPISAVKALTKEPEIGDKYTGKVVKTTEFGAFVELKKGTDGLLHVSNVGPGRVAHIEDVICAGRRGRRGRAGGRQGARPDRPEARGEARGRRPRPARGARWSERRTRRRATPLARAPARRRSRPAEAATATRTARDRRRRARRADRGARCGATTRSSSAPGPPARRPPTASRAAAPPCCSSTGPSSRATSRAAAA